jgi:hypothetical protein
MSTPQISLNDFLLNQAAINNERLQMDVRQNWQTELKSERYQQPLRLLRHGYKVYSQNEEDGIIAEILARIGKVPETFVEFGVETGLECNTLRLLMAGWKGLWMEGSANYVAAIQNNLADKIKSGHLAVAHSFVTTQNINQLIESAGFKGDLGLISIDIDGNDIWVWEALSVVSPAIVVIEYNASWAPPLNLAQPNDPAIYWQGTNYFGSSLEAQTRMGAQKGYQLVGCNFSGSNAFFVRKDLAAGKFHEPATAMEHHEPPRYWMRHLKAGHRPGVGPTVSVEG